MSSVLKTDLKVEIIEVRNQPKTCKVWHRGHLVFAGQSGEALMTARPLQGSMDIGEGGSMADLFADPEEEHQPSPKPGAVAGHWMKDAHHGKAHFLRQAYYYGPFTYGTPACGLNDQFVIASWLSKDPPENACGTCLRTTDWKGTLRDRKRDLPGNSANVAH